MQLEIIYREPPLSPIQPAPILFVHGAWHGAWCWDEHFLPYFASSGYHSYAVSLRGHGKSDGRERIRWWSIQDYVSDVAQAAREIEQKHGKRPVIVGHSLGGFVTQKYLEQHSAPAGVLLASIPHFGFLQGFLRYGMRRPMNLLQVVLTFSPDPMVNTPHRLREVCFSPEISQADLQRYFAQCGSESYRAALDVLFFSRVKTHQIKNPILVIGAQQDFLFPQNDVKRTAQAYGVQPVLFPSMAHDLMLEPAWQAVADSIIQWLSDQKLSS
jgi:pimeloyl-ACP methyl ester carboxylesterase